jgi:molecular chaperone GrpE (heat shock protein)
MREPDEPLKAVDSGTATQALLEEIADDTLRLIERGKRLEDRLDRLTEQVGALSQTQQDSERRLAVELGRMRQDLLGERKALVGRGSFNAVLPTLDSLRLMREALDDSPENGQIRAQLHAVIGSLANIVQSLGFVEFQVTPGSVFDPFNMECLGYQEGVADTVVSVVRPGYSVSGEVVRPCGVLLAQPGPSAEQPPSYGEEV